jgi:hypothetical protein
VEAEGIEPAAFGHPCGSCKVCCQKAAINDITRI